MLVRVLAALLILLHAAPAWAQTDPERPPFQNIPVLGVTTNNALVRFGDLATHSIRVNVVAGSAGGPSATIGAAFPTNVSPIGVTDSAGFTASLTLSNTGRLLTTCDNCSSSSFTDNTAFTAGVTSVGLAAGVFNDGLASVTSTNAAAARLTAQRGVHVNLRDEFGNRVGIGALPLRIDPTGTTTQPVSGAVTVSGTVTATGTVSAHQADTWTVQQGGAPWSVSQSGAWTVTSNVTPTIGSAFPSTVRPIGVADSGGFLASLTLTNNRLNVTCDNCGGSTFADNSAFTAGVSSVLNIGAVFNDGLAAVTSGNAAAPRITAQRGLHVNLRSNAGTALDTVNGILHVIASQGEANATPWAVSGTVTATGTVTAHQGDAWTVTALQGTSPWVVSGTVTATGTVSAHQADTWTVQAVQSGGWTVTATGTVTAHQGDTWVVGLSTGSNTIGAVTGTSADNSANSTLKLPTLSGRANAAAPTWTEGNQVPQSMTLTGDQRVRADTSGATATIAPSRVQIIGGWGTNATATQVTICDQYATVSITSTGNTQVITGVAGQQIRICTMSLIVASATAVGVFEGSGSLCNTNRTGLIGGAATGNGLNVANNGGTWGSGFGEIARTQTTGNNVCLGNSTAGVISGGIMWTRY